MEQKSDIITVKLQAEVPSLPTTDEQRGRFNFIKYGNGNDFPDKIYEANMKSAVNQGILTAKSAYILGKGTSLEMENKPNPKTEWNDFFNNIIEDYVTLGAFAYQVILNRDGKTYSLYHQPIETVRIKDLDEWDNPTSFLLCKNWKKYTQTKNLPVEIKQFDKDKVRKGQAFLVYGKDYTPGFAYYGLPSYFSAYNYIEADGMLGEFHRNSIENGFTPSVIISFSNNPSDEEKKRIQEDIERNFQGTKGANTIMITFGTDREQAPLIQAFDASKNQDLFNLLNDIVFQKIVTQNNLPSPTLQGISGSGNLQGNASEITNAFILYESTIISKLRKKILTSVNNFQRLSGYTDIVIEQSDFINQLIESKTAVVEQNMDKKDKKEDANG